MQLARRISLPLAGLALAGIAAASIAAAPAQDAGSGQPAPAPAVAPAPAPKPQSGTVTTMTFEYVGEDPGAPNEHHRKLAEMAGTWAFSARLIAVTGQEATLTGTSEIAAILGGRFVTEKVSSPTAPGGLFEGLGLSGYDNRTERYTSVWADNQSTAVLTMTGDDDATTGQIAWHGESPNPVTDAMEPVRSTIRKVSDTEWHYQSFRTSGGKEFMDMEIRYTKA